MIRQQLQPKVWSFPVANFSRTRKVCSSLQLFNEPHLTIFTSKKVFSLFFPIITHVDGMFLLIHILQSKMAPRDRKTKSEGDSLTQGPLQLWFFLSESITQSSWTQGIYTMDEVKKQDMSLDLCLKLSNNQGSTKDHSFWIASESMAAAVQLLSDDSIVAMYNLYCKNDATVQIIIRASDDPSPNAS